MIKNNAKSKAKETRDDGLIEKLVSVRRVTKVVKGGKTMRFSALVVVGDGKTYDLLVKLKGEYGSELDWVLPFPGDWHILKNYQRMIMKLYLDAGLKDFIEIFLRKCRKLTCTL